MLGADVVIDIGEVKDPAERTKIVREHTSKDRGADVVFECAGFLPAINEGLGYVRRSRFLVSLIVFVFVALLGVGGLSVLDVVFVTRALHEPSEAVGALLTVTGVGQLIGGVASWLLSRWAAGRYHRVLGASVIVSGVGTLIYAQTPTLTIAAVVLFFVGLAFPPIIVSLNTMIQLAVEDQFMGRVMSLVGTSMAVAIILSTTASGALTDLFGVRQVISAGGGILVVAGVIALFLIRSTPTGKIPPPESSPEPALAGSER